MLLGEKWRNEQSPTGVFDQVIKMELHPKPSTVDWIGVTPPTEEKEDWLSSLRAVPGEVQREEGLHM